MKTSRRPICAVDNTPLVVAFDDAPVAFARDGAFAFERGAPVATDLPTAATPWIALDRDHDGTIDSGAELFGSNTRGADGRAAVNGFAALADLDANHDGVIDARDPGFAALVLWADRDGDGRSSPAELVPLASVIVSISLADHVEARCDARGNCEGERAALTWRDPARRDPHRQRRRRLPAAPLSRDARQPCRDSRGRSRSRARQLAEITHARRERRVN